MNEIPEDKLIVHYDEEFKNQLIDSIDNLSKKIDGFDTEFETSDLKESVIDPEDNPVDADVVAFVIAPDEEIEVYCEAFNEYGECLSVLQKDLINLDTELETAQLIDYVEYFSSNLYLHRVSTTCDESLSYFNLMTLEAVADDLKVYFSPEISFQFSYLLYKNGHKEPVSHDAFVVIRGENLTLDQCRKVYKSFVFEANTVSDITIESTPNEPFDIDDFFLEEPDKDQLTTFKRRLILCDDTDKVIQLYNKAMCCDDDEVSILFYSKVLEFVSETVVRSKITDEARKALSSNRAMNPDANFIKELQNLFKDHSYQKDADSIKLTVQTCGYMSDLEDKIPSHIKRKVDTERKKGVLEALGSIADSITATRNSIAHAKANYRPSGKEIPEDQYNELSELLRVLAQQCIRWYAAQSPLTRVK
ncbi:hypothetical protein [Photobacterium leiognathi]|uniref:RiboL-PSP-HEPN domain-containing protein n=1 Tax=Photobacterium leiognathi TaxID=553611 RepID=A0ABX5GIG4_PHOLE|nr:hypothetical protein [Photobacterium leiognathi]KJF91634.1 hypothetical protein UB42_02160 [Photobacterium leiognathi]PSV85540.1 hypothetical protein CTM94_05550 [Photobacterium leiognathi]